MNHLVQRRLLWRAPLTVASALVLAVACSSLGPEDLARIEFSAGNGQIATVGTPVEVSPAVLAVDEKGRPIRGVTVKFEVTAGGGSISSATATTDEDGIATSGTWTLGPLTGENALTASAPGAAADLVFITVGLVGPPATVEKLEGDGQTFTAGRQVPINPQVRVTDQGGNAIKLLDVVFEVTSGGGAIAESLATTDTLGVAGISSWTLGAPPGTNTLVVRGGEVSATFTATGVSGPVQLSVVAGDSQTTVVGTPVPISPQVIVTDAQDLPVANVEVAFAAATGGGSVSEDTVRTNSGGIAQVDWTIGMVAGESAILAQVSGVGSVVFMATGLPGAPAQLAVFAGDQQFGAIDLQVPAPPAVLVTDEFDNPVPDVVVDFSVTAGGGAVTGAPATSDENGVATVGTWTLGPSEGQNTVEAVVAGVPAVTFSATALAEVFDIEIVRLGGAPGVSEVIDMAVNRWRSVIIGDLPEVSFAENPVDSATCGGDHAAFNDVVDDVRIFVYVNTIDGPGAILAAALTCIARDNGGLTVVGAMRFDVDDIQNLRGAGLLDDVVIHEIGHILGIGSLWDDFGFLINPSLPNNEGADTHFSGPRAIEAFDAVGGVNFGGGSKVPVENRQGAQGTRDSHWRESVFGNELMTGFIDLGANPLSVVTVESLADLGYVVNANRASDYQLAIAAPATGAGAGAATGAAGIPLVGDVDHGPVYLVGRDGRVTGVIHR